MKRQRALQEAILAQFTPQHVLTRFQDVATAGADIVQTDLPQSLIPFLADLAIKAKALPVATIELTPDGGIDEYDPDYPVHQAARRSEAPPADPDRHTRAVGMFTPAPLAASADYGRDAPCRQVVPRRVASVTGGCSLGRLEDMTATLRVMLDQLVAPTEPDLAEASRELGRALVAGAPAGCEVEGIAPAGQSELAGGSRPRGRTAHRARETRAQPHLQLGLGTGIGAGMIHSPSLFAPLVRHDRVHDNDQTVVTIWDLRPWEAPAELSRAAGGWHRAMLKRAARYADAVVVPTHAIAARLAELAPLGDRIRVIAGASPSRFAVPTDEVGRRRALDLPEGFVLLSGGPVPSDGLESGLAAMGRSGLDLPVVVIDTHEGDEPAVAELASAAGIPERSLHVRGPLAAADRAAVFGGAVAFLAPSRRAAFPWRVVDALTLGVPVVAADSAVHSEVIVDGGSVVQATDAASLADALAHALSGAA